MIASDDARLDLFEYSVLFFGQIRVFDQAFAVHF